MALEKDEILDQPIEEFLRAKIERHKEKAKQHLSMAEEAQRQLDLLTGASNGSVFNIRTKINGSGSGGKITLATIKISKSLVEDFLEKNSDRSFRTEDIIKGIAPEYLASPDHRTTAINKVSQILIAAIKQKRVSKYKSSGKGNKYAVNKSYLESKNNASHEQKA